MVIDEYNCGMDVFVQMRRILEWKFSSQDRYRYNAICSIVVQAHHLKFADSTPPIRGGCELEWKVLKGESQVWQARQTRR